MSQLDPRILPGCRDQRIRAALAAVRDSLPEQHQLTRVFDQHSKQVMTYIPRTEQAELDRLVAGGCLRLLGGKSRRIGFSLWATITMFWRWYFAVQPEQFLVIAHRDVTVKRILTTAPNSFRALMSRLPKVMQREMSVDSSHELQLLDTGATILGITEGGKGGARAEGVTGVWMTEFAHYTDQSELWTTVEATISEMGWAWIETTVNAPGDLYHKMVTAAEKGEGDWTLAFFAWHKHARYTSPVPEPLVLTEQEQKMRAKYNLTDGQVQWWRAKKASLGKKFDREYPASVDDMFRGIDGAYLDSEALDDIDVSTSLDENGLWVSEEPVPGEVYAHGIDTAGGVQGDYSVITTVACSTGQPARMWVRNDVSPARLAEIAAETERKYPGIILVESNNHGHLVLYRLRELGIPDYTRARKRGLWVDPNTKKDWTTNKGTKLLAFDVLRAFLEAKRIQLLPLSAVLELRALVEPKGVPEAPAGQHDDIAVSLALAYYATRSVPVEMRIDSVRERGNARMKKLVASRIRRRGIPWSYARPTTMTRSSAIVHPGLSAGLRHTSRPGRDGSQCSRGLRGRHVL